VNRRRRGLAAVLRVLISLALLAALVVTVDTHAIVQRLKVVGWREFAIGCLVYQAAAIGANSARWDLLLRGSGERVPFGRLAALNWIGNFFSLLLPTTVGGDLVRMYELSKDLRERAKAAASVFLDRVLGFAALAILALGGIGASWLAGMLAPGSEFVALLSGAVLGAIALLASGRAPRFLHRSFAFPLRRKLEGLAKQFYHALREMAESRRRLVAAATISIVAQIGVVIAVIVAGEALGLDVLAYEYFAFVPIVLFASALPLSVGGLGVRETAFVLLFTEVGVAAADAVALSVLVYAYFVATGVVGAMIWGALTISRVVRTGPNAARFGLPRVDRHGARRDTL